MHLTREIDSLEIKYKILSTHKIIQESIPVVKVAEFPKLALKHGILLNLPI